MIERYGGDAGTMLYCDPPYVGDVRRRNYKVEMTHSRDHRALATALTECRATVILSGYYSELYADLYRDWHRREFISRTEQSPIGRSGERVEVVWSNREFCYTGTSEGDDVTKLPALCGHCSRVIPRRATGRPARWRSAACRVAAHRAAKATV
ncbi:hypothetical protein ASU32_23185 [Tsukamurella tyrosinosolvens]|nr:hypothetical protein ASU32_23185 [Tsukamurella tyrosinosolvens]